jgi:hypothetical protein
MPIEAEALSTCRVVEGGERIALRFVDAAGNPNEVLLSTSDASAIAMTLPRLLRTALGSRFGDDTLRYVFPLDGWRIEAASDGRNLILTLATNGGFEVSFAAEPAAVRSLGSALAERLPNSAQACARARN